MDTLEYLVDYNQVANKVALRKEILFKQIEENVEATILSMKPSQTLSFRIKDSMGHIKNIPMAAEKRYAKVLWNFLRNKNYVEDGEIYEIESEVTTPILNQVEKTTIAFYSSSETTTCIASAISEAISTSRIVRASVGSNVDEARKAIQKEVASKTANYVTSDVKNKMVEQTTDQIIAFLNTSMMQKIVHTVGACVTTGAGKILVTKIAVILSKSISAAALKTAVMSIVKKIGLTTIAKTAIGKALAVAFATIGLSANAAIFAALIPIIALVLIHEYKTFPKKLAKKVPAQIVCDLRNNFDTMNKQIVRNIMSELSKQIMQQQNDKKRRESNKIRNNSKWSLLKKLFILAIGVLILLLAFISFRNKTIHRLTKNAKVEKIIQHPENNLTSNVKNPTISHNKNIAVANPQKSTPKTTDTVIKVGTIEGNHKNQKSMIPSNFIFVSSGKLTHLFVDYDEQVNPIYKNFSVNSFYICKYEVTQREYKAIIGKNPSKYIGEELPIHNITNAEALIFCQKKSEKEGYDGFYIIKGSKVFLKQKGNGYRLPTDHEWAFAARKGNEAKAYKYAAGNNLNDIAWYGRNSNNRPHKIGLKKPNDRGLYDMCGNVSELAHIGRKEIWSKGGSYEEWPYDGHVFHEDDARGYSGGGINSKEKDPTAGIRLVFIPKGMEPSFYL